MIPADSNLRAIFCDAAEIDNPVERAAFLDSACKGDPALRQRIERLLAADTNAGGFLHDTPNRPEVGAAKVGERIGRYRILQRLGQGGYGVVYRAEQEEPVRREVALKIIKLGMDTGAVVARFELERQALALMDHPNIARVLDAGATETGRPFFVMELVRGVPITDYCRKRNLSVSQRIELFIQVCHAVQHAHQKGIIHRDLKPSNILVAEQDGVRLPKVIDFGIAKATEIAGTEGMTAAHEFVGTPAYMSPEQVTPGVRDIDTRSDVYGLGVILYELLAGQPPYNAKALANATLEEMRRLIREADPPRPSALITKNLKRGPNETSVTSREHLSALRGDLDWIVMKCLEKDRARRYESANALALDLRRHLDHEPVAARPPTGAYRLQKVVRRNRLAFSASGIIALVLVVAIIVTSRLAYRAIYAEREQHTLRALAEAKAGESNQRLIRRYVAEGNRLMEDGLPLQALPWMVEALALESGDLEREREERLRIAETRVGAPSLRLHLAQGKSVHAVALSPDGRLLASGGDDGTIFLSDVAGGAETGIRLMLPGPIGTLRFSPDGSRIAAADMKGRARVWNATSGESVTEILQAQDFNERTIARVKDQLRPTAHFSPDGKLLLLAWGSKSAQLRDSTTGNLVREFKHPQAVYHAAFSADGQWVVTSSEDGTAHVWNAASGESAAPPLPHSGMVAWSQFSSDGSKLLTVRDRRLVQLWDWREGKRLGKEFHRRATVYHASWSPDDSKVLTVAGSGMAHLYDVESTLLLNQFIHPGRLIDASFSPDGYYVAIACDDGNVWLWDVNDSQRRPLLLPSGNLIEEITFDRDGRFLAVGSRGGYARVWELFPAGQGGRRLLGHDVQGVEFDPSGRRALLVNTGTRSGLNLYEVPAGKLIFRTALKSNEVTQARFNPDGDLIIAFGNTANPLIVDADSGKVVRRLAHKQRVRDVAWSADGKFIFAATGSGVQKWDAESGDSIASFAHPSALRTMSLSTDGKRLATGHDDKSVILWNTASGQREAVSISVRESICDVRFSPDGTALGIASFEEGAEGIVEFRDVVSGNPMGRPLRHRDDVAAFTFSRDGRWLATACVDHTARVWDVRTGEPVTPWLPHEFEAEQVIFSPDATRLLTVARRGAVRLWNPRTGEPITAPIQYFRNTGNGAVSYSSDGQRLLIARGASEAWLRDLQPDGASLHELRLLAQVLSCTQFDPAAGMVPLDAPGLERAWHQLRSFRVKR